jgi:hypothetical protein
MAKPASKTGAATPEPSTRLALPDRPSIAVLAFENMSGDPEQEYFADGSVEEWPRALNLHRSALSDLRWLAGSQLGKPRERCPLDRRFLKQPKAPRILQCQ